MVHLPFNILIYSNDDNKIANLVIKFICMIQADPGILISTSLVLSKTIYKNDMDL